MSLYDALGTSSDATAAELRQAFVAQARRFHPDRHVGAEPSVQREAERRMREVTEAWAVLGDPERRRYYDLGLGDPVARGGRGRAPDGGRGGPGERPGGSGSVRPPTWSGGPTGGVGSAGTAGSGPSSSEGRPWRSYASPGPGSGARSAGEHVLWLSPVLLLGAAGLLGVAGAWIRWPPFYAMALVCLVLAAGAFFMLPIWAMTRGRSGGHRGGRGGRGPKRSY